MAPPDQPQLGLHVIAKPIGPICNLDCSYCFYLRKESLYAPGEGWRMSDETLAAYIRQYIEAQPAAVEQIEFAFQGGEPTLLGLDFFRRAVELQSQHAPPGKRIHNSLQTNGLLLNDAWCEFLRAHRFLVGLSLDGPADLHDKFRRDKQGGPTFDRVMRAMDCLRKHGVEFNVLTCVHRHNAEHPLRVYQFLRDRGVEFIQFIPVVESVGRRGILPRPADTNSRSETPLKRQDAASTVTPESVLPEQFGRFLIGVFDQWVRHDVGRVFIRDFDEALAAWVGAGPSLCIYAPQCGRAMAIEHNGDLYSCDHYVDGEHRLGNIHDAPIAQLANSAFQQQFGRDKQATLPELCRNCPVGFICNGACPKDRFLRTPDGQPGLNYLCAGYKQFFGHVGPYMEAMAAEVRAGRPAAGVMRQLRAQSVQARAQASAAGHRLGRNAPCPCGSGKKFKKCCM